MFKAIVRRWRALQQWFNQMFAQMPVLERVDKPDYVKALLPHSSFTKAMTHSRQRQLRKVLRRMTQPQLRICKRKGWDRGMLQESANGTLHCE